MLKKYLLPIFTFFIITNSCNRDYVPKPPGYLRIDFPEKKYIIYNTSCPYSFAYPEYAKIEQDTDFNTEPCWINIDFPQFNGKIHISYKTINNNINGYIEDSRKFVYKHTIRADAINEKIYSNNENNVHGILYDIKGNVASSVQFFMTDSTEHFIRGALYFNVRPNKDSLAPVINFIRKDIVKLIETLEWK
ncbi:MAG: gliding motility lipoprotein GldD [Bacteroidales bacterium]|nr:gliding motility lipoprotein GldD [Bacteroidales bacterium]